MANLAESLAALGYSVTYVANESISPDREKMGWIAPKLVNAKLRIAGDATEVAQIALTAPTGAVHFCQGLRGNGLVAIAQRILKRGGALQWIILEAVDDDGLRGYLKRLLYKWLLESKQPSLQGILGIGWRTPDWLIARGACPQNVFPFAYFLPDSLSTVRYDHIRDEVFRFVFVGQLVKRKRVDWLIRGLASLDLRKIELVIIGDGPMRKHWELLANELLPNRVRWKGYLSIDEIPQQVVKADCLVLPSRHDGWGAVVSEALMLGVPVICSDACGSAGVVRASGTGDVFPRNDADALSYSLATVLSNGPLSSESRDQLRAWSRRLGSNAGARYLDEILQFIDQPSARPRAPWITTLE